MALAKIVRRQASELLDPKARDLGGCSPRGGTLAGGMGMPYTPAMNITYCWTEPSGYLAACINELARRPGLEVTLVHWAPSPIAPFDPGLFRSLTPRVLSESERADIGKVRDVVVESRPDVVIFAGWAHKPYVSLLDDPRLRGAKFVMTADTALRFTWRQRLAPLRIGRLLGRVDAVNVPGDRGYQVMRSWGVPGRKVARLLYAIDYDGFLAAGEPRFEDASWPKRFLFVGRYVPAKAIDVLVAAYRDYRSRVDSPWPLTTCGAGPLESLLAGVEGIDNRGFLQPSDLGRVFRESGVFILPSRVEPWGQVIVEAAAAGLPVICSQDCGAGVELVRDYHTGFVIPTDDIDACRRALERMHHSHDGLATMGREIRHAAAAYSAERWADNQIGLCERLLQRPV
jgi:glycosyltransferase involved in cell wall biosynthesis